jgi:hypothetical protein
MRDGSSDVLDAKWRLGGVDSDLGRSVHDDCLLRNDHLPDPIRLSVLSIGTESSASLLVVALLPDLISAGQSDIFMLKLPQVQNLVLIRPQNFLNLSARQSLPFVRVTQSCHCISKQRRVSSMRVVICGEFEVVPIIHLPVEQFEIESEIGERVQLFGVEE